MDFSNTNLKNAHIENDTENKAKDLELTSNKFALGLKCKNYPGCSFNFQYSRNLEISHEFFLTRCYL